MVYSEALAARVRTALGGRRGVTEIKMMGGLSFTLGGHMCCGVIKDELVVRVGRDQYELLLAKPHARPMDFTGRPLKGFLYISQDGLRTNRALASWVERAAAFAARLPAKVVKRRRR